MIYFNNNLADVYGTVINGCTFDRMQEEPIYFQTESDGQNVAIIGCSTQRNQISNVTNYIGYGLNVQGTRVNATLNLENETTDLTQYEGAGESGSYVTPEVYWASNP
jgi:hypothetical protein